ncbi:hypothetical protein JS528_11155 [Bifidobacterium sp. MA2]|uniref:Uncharacterized protein n=1 Tax=Bifidobacterium santillanense TaxID=2809028 RepID=A0ABS5USF7_9BIFI|nr:hypothetical protein [Bifidobacterium santillanense]MBT1173877.1 hypothetical protein [Bifidobacterium santillanense]
MNPLQRWPALITIGMLAVELACWAWLFTHMACAHPIGNGLASLTAFILIPIGFMALIEAQELPPAQLPSTHIAAGAAGGDKDSR